MITMMLVILMTNVLLAPGASVQPSSTVQYSAVQYSTVQYCTVQYSTVVLVSSPAAACAVVCSIDASISLSDDPSFK